jgi:hypothetical protein
MARATTIMMAVIKRSNIIFLSWSQTLSLQRLQDLRFRARVLLKDAKSRMPEARRGSRDLSAMPPPIALTDAQTMAILAGAAPLAAQDRNPFLLEVVQALQALPKVGDGALHRVIMAVQRKFWDPPELDHQPRHGRRTVAR